MKNVIKNTKVQKKRKNFKNKRKKTLKNESAKKGENVATCGEKL